MTTQRKQRSMGDRLAPPWRQLKKAAEAGWAKLVSGPTHKRGLVVRIRDRYRSARSEATRRVDELIARVESRPTAVKKAGLPTASRKRAGPP